MFFGYYFGHTQFKYTKKRKFDRHTDILLNQNPKFDKTQGVGHGRGITARGRAAGLRGNSNRQVAHPVQRGAIVGAPAVTVGVRGAGQTRHNVRGTQRAKPPPNLPGEDGSFFLIFSTYFLV
jgi:hypothetical protein